MFSFSTNTFAKRNHLLVRTACCGPGERRGSFPFAGFSRSTPAATLVGRYPISFSVRYLFACDAQAGMLINAVRISASRSSSPNSRPFRPAISANTLHYPAPGLYQLSSTATTLSSPSRPGYALSQTLMPGLAGEPSSPSTADPVDTGDFAWCTCQGSFRWDKCRCQLTAPPAGARGWAFSARPSDRGERPDLWSEGRGERQALQ